jgi:hypothetical protein
MGVTVLMNAGPWLPVPPNGYGGVENIVATLVPELRKRGVRVVLATVGTSTLPVDDQVSLLPDGRFEHLLKPCNRVSGIAPAHLHRVPAELRARDDIDFVHDHVEVIGLSTLAAACVPALRTLHWDLAKNRDSYATVDVGPRLFVNGVSADQLRAAPPSLLRHSLGHVHLATPLAETAASRPLPAKAEHVVVLGRVTRCKGRHIAVRVDRYLELYRHVLGAS